MSDATDQLAVLQANNAADATALAALAEDLNAAPAETAADQVLSAAVSALEAAGYTVTPPAETV